MTKVAIEYEPREQFQAFHKRTQRWACMVCHRRAGKTVAAVNELIIRALYTKKKNARYAYVAPFFRQAKDVAWQYLKQGCLKFAIKIRESALRIELPNGAWITLYGSDNPDAMRGLYFDGVILDEYGDCRPSLWSKVILPTLADRKGWALFIGTPKGRNHFYRIHKRSQEESGWFNLTLKASESGILDNTELLEMKAQMEPEEFEQEMECNFTAAVKGTYYASIIQQMEVNGNISIEVALYDLSYSVKVACDLGRSDNTAMWFWQETPRGICIIDYYENQGEHLDHYIEMLNSKSYRYEELWVPHDAVAKTLATKRSTIEQLLDAGFPCKLVPRLAVQHGIDAVRKVLPTFKINQNKCFAGVEALRAYQRHYSEVTKQFNDSPKHDWASDGADAMRYMALVCQEKADHSRIFDHQQLTTQAHHSYSLNDLHSDRARSLREINLRV